MITRLAPIVFSAWRAAFTGTQPAESDSNNHVVRGGLRVMVPVL